MNILNKFSLTIAALLLGSGVFAQDPMVDDQAQSNTATKEGVTSDWMPSLVKDGVIETIPHENRVVDWTPIREIDVAWKRRVWRQIDTRQKQNQAFRFVGDEYSGGGAFIEILIDAVRKGKIAAYNNADDRFTIPLDIESFDRSLGGKEDSTLQEDPITGEQIWSVVKTEFNVNSVTQYQIKEDWIFDRNLGRLVVRIIGIAPLMDRTNESTGEYMYSTPMFWLYYPDLRKVLVNYEVYNPQNDISRISWTDFFDNRYFESYVIKTSANNPTSRRLPENSLRALQEGKNLEQKIIEREMDMWVD